MVEQGDLPQSSLIPDLPQYPGVESQLVARFFERGSLPQGDQRYSPKLKKAEKQIKDRLKTVNGKPWRIATGVVGQELKTPHYG